MLTLRFFGFALVFPALLLMGNWLSFLVPIALLYGVGLLFILLLDRRAAGKSEQFRVTRSHDNKLSLGAQNRIAFHVQSRARRNIPIWIRDEAPLMFVGAEEAEVAYILEAQESTDLAYYLRPLKRGDYAFGDIHIRWQSPLNFYIRQAKIPAAIGVKVYPNLHEIRKYDLLVRRDQLAEMGLKNVRLRGEGSQFESLRDYTPDDPYRRINWKATARRAKPISMDFEPERSQRVMIALDIGRMMRSPIRVDDPDGVAWNMSKVDFVINSVLLFSYVATLKGDQVGLLVFADRVQQYLAPQGGRAHFQKILDTMYGLQSEAVEPDYGQAINYLHTQNKKRSLVVIFTDLSGLRASESLMKYVPRLLPRHLPMLVTIRDPALDLEAEHVPHSSDLMYRRAVAEQLLDERRVLLETLSRHGVVTLDVDAVDITMAVVSRYLQLKAHSFL
jgi:uncharacterized protein (DUF58 family)